MKNAAGTAEPLQQWNLVNEHIIFSFNPQQKSMHDFLEKEFSSIETNYIYHFFGFAPHVTWCHFFQKQAHNHHVVSKSGSKNKQPPFFRMFQTAEPRILLRISGCTVTPNPPPLPLKRWHRWCVREGRYISSFCRKSCEKIKRLTLKRKRSEHTLNQKWTLYMISITT